MNQQISEKIRLFANSVELYNIVEKIGAKFKLHIDQMGSLDAEIGDVLLGFSKSSEFINNTIKRLEINESLANQIATEVNKEIFATIKSNLQTQTESNELTISSIEQAGNFRVEKEAPEQTNNTVTPADRARILAGVEDPQTPTSAQTSNFSTPLVSGSSSGQKSSSESENYTEPLVDYLLANPIAQSEKKVTVETKDTVPQAKIAPAVPVVPKKEGPDPYREAVK